MQHVIFYSWQGDLPNNTNRGLIKSALDEAASALVGDLTVEPRIDHDTQNVPGSPDITRTILKKIDASDVFVADVTLINPKIAQRRTPNPNVLLELGYAMKALGEDRIVLVMNEHYGPVEQLPFDLRARRTIVYNTSPEATERPTERHRLASILKTAIKIAIDTISQPPLAPSIIDLATNAIETVAPNRALLVRNAIRDITTTLEGLAPPQFRSGGTVEQLLSTIDATIPVVREFTGLAQTIASMNDTEAARALYKNFTTLLEHYDNPRGFSGPYDERDFDYWRFLGHELLVTLIAPLLHEERYETIAALLDEPFTLTNSPIGRGIPVDFTYASQWIRSFEKLNELHRKLSYHGYVIQQRHDGPLAAALPLQQFVAADYLLFLRGELATEQAQERECPWVPWSGVYLRETPHFIHSAARTAIAQRLATALGVPDATTLKTRLHERADKLSRLFGRGVEAHQQPLTEKQIDTIGTR